MEGPGYLIDPPSPYELPYVWLAFLERLNDYDHNDPTVAHEIERAVRLP